ncbi:glycosyltransferase [bacterium]|nr:glycosyltransferase [bacterium]
MTSPLAILFHRIGPYHQARLRGAARHGEVVAVELSATTKTYAWDHVDLPENVRRVTLFKDSDSRDHSMGEVARRLDEALRDLKPCALAVGGWSDNGALAAIQWCSRKKIPVIAMSDSQEIDAPRHFVKEWVKRRLVELFSAGIVAGERHGDYLVHLGLKADRIVGGYDVVDNDYFRSKAEEVRENATAVREKNGLPERYFLSSCRFVEKKNLFRLMDAFAAYRKETPPDAAWDLVMVGDGPQREELVAHRQAFGLESAIHFPGFQQIDTLPEFYGLASAFVLASTVDQWGLVVNEAMASALPVLVSRNCGSSELVEEGRNGFAFNPRDTQDIARCLKAVSGADADPVAMGKRSLEIVAGYSPEVFGENIWKAAEIAQKAPPPKGSMITPVLFRVLDWEYQKLRGDTAG